MCNAKSLGFLCAQLRYIITHKTAAASIETVFALNYSILSVVIQNQGTKTAKNLPKINNHGIETCQ